MLQSLLGWFCSPRLRGQSAPSNLPGVPGLSGLALSWWRHPSSPRRPPGLAGLVGRGRHPRPDGRAGVPGLDGQVTRGRRLDDRHVGAEDSGHAVGVIHIHRLLSKEIKTKLKTSRQPTLTSTAKVEFMLSSSFSAGWMSHLATMLVSRVIVSFSPETECGGEGLSD